MANFWPSFLILSLCLIPLLDHSTFFFFFLRGSSAFFKSATFWHSAWSSERALLTSACALWQILAIERSALLMTTRYNFLTNLPQAGNVWACSLKYLDPLHRHHCSGTCHDACVDPVCCCCGHPWYCYQSCHYCCQSMPSFSSCWFMCSDKAGTTCWTCGAK